MVAKKRNTRARVARFKAGKELVKRRGSKKRKVAKFKAGKELNRRGKRPKVVRRARARR